MRGRRSVWSDPKVKRLAGRFIPCADEVWYLQHRPGPECDFFRLFCEQGHYGGRTVPTDTRQGIYCVAPSGRFLASINTTDPRAMARMLELALERWESLPRAERLPAASPPAPPESVKLRGEARYPEGGLALAVHSRNLPRERGPSDWRAEARNRDYAWFTAEEARAIAAGGAVPAALVRRLARCNFVDNVYGQTHGYQEKEIEKAEWTATVEKVAGTRTHLVFRGATRAVSGGRGVSLSLDGRAVFDGATGRFEVFEMVAIGERWGGTQYNCRDDDPGPSGIGFALVLAGEHERVAPALVWNY